MPLPEGWVQRSVFKSRMLDFLLLKKLPNPGGKAKIKACCLTGRIQQCMREQFDNCGRSAKQTQTSPFFGQWMPLAGTHRGSWANVLVFGIRIYALELTGVSYRCDSAREPTAFSARPIHTVNHHCSSMSCHDVRTPILHPQSYSHHAEVGSEHRASNLNSPAPVYPRPHAEQLHRMNLST